MNRTTLHALMLIFCAEGVSEVPDPAAKRAPNLGQPLRTEHEQRDHEHEQQMGWLKDVANHCHQTVAEATGRANASVSGFRNSAVQYAV